MACKEKLMEIIPLYEVSDLIWKIADRARLKDDLDLMKELLSLSGNADVRQRIASCLASELAKAKDSAVTGDARSKIENAAPGVA